MEQPVNWPSGLRLSGQLPTGWHVKESLTFIEADAQANVIASSEPIDPSVSSEQYAWRQGELVREEFPGYEELSFGPRQLFGARLGYERRFRWQPPDGVPIQQIQLYYVEAARGYTATATTTVTNFGCLHAELERVLSGLHLAGDPGVVGLAASSVMLPLDDATLRATFDRLGYRYQVLSPGAVLAPFSLVPEQAGRSQLVLIAQLDSPDEFSLLAQAPHESYPPLSAWWELLDMANAWNEGHGRPVAVVKRRPTEPIGSEIMLRHRLHLPHGASIAQLASTTEQVLVASVDFWTWAHGEYGI